jgi:hypothetical protein
VDARRLAIACAVTAAGTLVAATVLAQDPSAPPPNAVEPSASLPIPVAFSADHVRLDVHAGALGVDGHVRVEEPPFYFASDALELKRVPIGVELRGDGRLEFCRCLGTPIAVRFTGATVAPPHDAILRNPVLEIFGVPVAWLPVFWLRSPGRVGLLPPDVAWRGRDGLFVGDGFHLPWAQGDREHGLDLRGGGYVDGGVVVDGVLRTTTSSTHVRWDRLRADDGVTLDTFGATSPSDAASKEWLAWDAHALLGARAVQATTDVEVAARRVDRAQVEAAWRGGGWTFGTGFRAAAQQGGSLRDLGSGRPVVIARRADGLGRLGSYDLTVEGGQIAGEGQGAVTFARGTTGVLATHRIGPFGISGALNAYGDVAQAVARSGWDGTVQARGRVALPLERPYPSDDDHDPWTHRTEPRLEAAVLATHTEDILADPPGPGTEGPTGAAWTAAAGWSNLVGRTGSRDAADVDVAGGVVGGAKVRPALRARASVGQTWATLRADFARVMWPASAAGGALVAYGRVGPAGGLHLSAQVAERDGIDPIVARMLVSPSLEPESRFLASPGWTGGAWMGIPLGPRITARGGADIDLDAPALVDASAALEFHDPCNCVVLRAAGAHRVGRPGVDVWIAVDVPVMR